MRHILIQRMVGIGVGLVSFLSLLLIHRLPVWFDIATQRGMLLGAFLIIMIVWLGSMYVGQQYLRRDQRVPADAIILGFTTAVAFLGITSLVEVAWLRVFLYIVLGVFIGLLYGWTTVDSVRTMHTQKIIRRHTTMLWVFDTYALVTTLYALDVFFQQAIPFWLLSLLAGLVFAGASYMIWRMYVDKPFHFFALWLLIMVLCMFELTWVMHMLPLGYLALGFVVTWVWYVCQLLCRFHFSSRGIVWKKQIPFLAGNAALYACVLFFFVRWI